MNRFTFAGLMLVALLLAAPIASAQDGWPGCPWGDAYNPMMMLRYGPECLSRPAASGAALKPAGLAKPAPAEQFVPCSFGEGIDPLLDPLALACLSQSVPAAKAASKPVGLAALAPTPEQFGPCGAGEPLDPLLDPRALACLSQPIPAAKSASKPAGLAAPAPAANPHDGLPCLPWGEVYDPMTMTLSSAPECVSRPVGNAAAPKTAGLAAPALARAKQDQAGQGCPPGYAYSLVRRGYPGECLPEANSAVSAAPKSAGLATPAQAQEQFGPCGSSGESPDPLAWPLACLR